MVQGTPTQIEMAMEEAEEQGFFLVLGREDGVRKVNEYRPWKVTINTAAIFFGHDTHESEIIYIPIYYGVREGTRKEGCVGHLRARETSETNKYTTCFHIGNGYIRQKDYTHF